MNNQKQKWPGKIKECNLLNGTGQPNRQYKNDKNASTDAYSFDKPGICKL